jgi:hypothetical protein
MIYPLVRDLATDGIPVVVTCRVLGFSPQGFYSLVGSMGRTGTCLSQECLRRSGHKTLRVFSCSSHVARTDHVTP